MDCFDDLESLSLKIKSIILDYYIENLDIDIIHNYNIKNLIESLDKYSFIIDKAIINKNKKDRRKKISNTIKINEINTDLVYIKINSFIYTKEIDKVVKYFESTEKSKLILDLRDNGGGSINNLTKVANYLLPKVQLFNINSRNNRGKKYITTGHNIFDKIVVLINKNTASASEILAGTIRLCKKGVLIGENSFGKTSVQEFIDLNSRYALKLTTAKYYLFKNVDITNKGLKADIVISKLDILINILKLHDIKYNELVISKNYSTDILNIQIALIILGYEILDSKGKMGIYTKKAIESFKKINNIIEDNFGYETFKSLKNESNKCLNKIFLKKQLEKAIELIKDCEEYNKYLSI